jgi:hypothetical protein
MTTEADIAQWMLLVLGDDMPDQVRSLSRLNDQAQVGLVVLSQDGKVFRVTISEDEGDK